MHLHLYVIFGQDVWCFCTACGQAQNDDACSFSCSLHNTPPFRPYHTYTKVRGERERLSRLKAAHAGVNAKAWDTSHASLDRELAKFQKFLKSKARRVAEEEVLQVHDVLCPSHKRSRP